MWFIAFFVFVGSAVAGDASDIKTRAPATHSESMPIQGKLALENAVRGLGYQLDNLEVIETEYTEGIRAPSNAVVERRHQKWSQQFGQTRLTVHRKRLLDNVILDETATSRRIGADKPICTTADAQDTRDITLHTFGNIQRHSNTVESEGDIQNRQQLYYLADDQSRTAVAKLAPGESVTVVEVFGGPTKQPKRQIKVRRAKSTLTITETTHQREVCISPSHSQ